MFSFMAIFLSIWVALYVLFLFVVKLSQREKVDPVFKGKMQGIRIRWDPRIKLFENIFAWALVILFIYFIYLG